MTDYLRLKTRIVSPETLKDGRIRLGCHVCHVDPITNVEESRLVSMIRAHHRGTVITHRSAATLLDPGIETERNTYHRYIRKIAILVTLCRRFPVVEGSWQSRRGSYSGPTFQVRQPGWPSTRLIGDPQETIT